MLLCSPCYNGAIWLVQGVQDMVQSKAWDWDKVSDKDVTYWKTPAAKLLSGKPLATAGKARLFRPWLRAWPAQRLFCKKGFHTSAFDLSRDAVEQTQKWARVEHLAITGTVGDMLALPYPDASFDCIFSKDVISYTDTQGVKRAEILRILKPAGECYLTLGSKKAWGFRPALAGCG